MKKALKFFLPAIVFSTTGLFAYAQDQTTGQPAPQATMRTLTSEQRADRLTANLRDTLGLSGEQVNQVKAIFLKQEKQREEDRRAFAGQKTALQEASKKREQVTQSEMAAVLSKEQFQKFLAYRHGKRQEVKQGHQEVK